MSEAYSEPCLRSKMELFAKIVNSFQPVTIFAKSSILDIWLGSEYTKFMNTILLVDMLLQIESAAYNMFMQKTLPFHNKEVKIKLPCICKKYVKTKGLKELNI